MSRQDEIRTILATATQQAYEQGWNDAMAAFRQVIAEGGATTPLPALGATQTVDRLNAVVAHARRRRGGRPNNSAAMVLAAITAVPGQTGVTIAKLLPDIHERTMRTALRRLRIAGQIEQRNGGWFLVSERDR